MSEKNTMKLPVFVSSEAEEVLRGMTFEKRNFRTVEYTLEYVVRPYYIYFEYSEKEIRMTLYQRTSMSTADIDESDLGYATSSDTGEDFDTSKLEASCGEEGIDIFFKLAVNLNLYIQEKGLDKTIEELDPENCGLVISAVNGILKAKVVKGAQRPYIACYEITGLFSRALTLARPYSNEAVMSGFADMMSRVFGNVDEDDFDEEDFSEEDSDEEDSDEEDSDEDEVDKDMLSCLYGVFSRLSGNEDDNLHENDIAGILKAMERAKKYENGDDENDSDPEKALMLYTRLAEEFDIGGAQYRLGFMYYAGKGVKRDFEKAAYWMIRATENGDNDGEKNYEHAQECAKKMKEAEAGNAEQQAEYSKLFTAISEALDGDEECLAEAFAWAQKSADGGCPEGIYLLALCYNTGRGVKKNMKKAEELYEKGAAEGNASCITNLANIYAEGDEEEQKKAFELFKKAAELGNGFAMRNLGRCYQYEIGTEFDMDKAREWYIKSAEFFPDDEEFQAKVELYKMGF